MRICVLQKVRILMTQSHPEKCKSELLIHVFMRTHAKVVTGVLLIVCGRDLLPGLWQLLAMITHDRLEVRHQMHVAQAQYQVLETRT